MTTSLTLHLIRFGAQFPHCSRFTPRFFAKQCLLSLTCRVRPRFLFSSASFNSVHHSPRRRFSVSVSAFQELNNHSDIADERYDVIVVGGGHAGCEAALASARLGAKTLLLTINIDCIAWQPCNPAVGGPVKSQLVHEVDALGDEIGKVADSMPHLSVRESMVTDILVGKNDNVEGVQTFFGVKFYAPSVVLTTGTFMSGNFPLPRISSSVSTGTLPSNISEEATENGFHFSGDKEKGGLNFDEPFNLSELKRFESPTVEVKELDELPEQWRRAKLAWLCKELPAHRPGTFVRVLNAQRKWIRQDDCTYVAVHCIRIRENESAFRVYKWMVQQHWFQFDFALATKLAEYMGKERKYLKCREIFDDITNQGLVPNEFTFHILIVAYLSSSASSCLEEACSIYNQMIHLGNYKPRLSLHNSLFRAVVSKTGTSCKHHLKQAEFIFHNLTSCGLRIHKDIYGGLLWLHSYQDVIDKERIASLRAEMKSVGVEDSVEVLVSVLRACAKEGDHAEAERTWREILSFHKKPPTQAYLYLMEVYSKAGEPLKSVEIFRNMQEQSSINIVSYYKIIEVLCKAEETKLAESLMREFINSGLKPLTRSFIDMMNMYADLSLHDKVESTFFWCQEQCHSNQTVYNLFLDSLVQTNNLDKAEDIFGQMYADEAIGVDAKSCNTILRGYLTFGHNAKAEKIYDFMCDKKYEIDSSLMEKLEYVLSLRWDESKRSTTLKLSKEQREILIGLLLGGLRIKLDEEKKSYAIDFVFRENCDIKSFLKRHIYNQFHEWLSCKLPIDNVNIPSQLTTIPHSYFQLYADQFWPQGQPVIPKLIHQWLTPRVLAYWYMYGGYSTSSGDILLKLRFGEEDVLRIAKMIKTKSLNCRVKRKGRTFWIGFLGSNAAEFWKLVEPFILADLKESLQSDIKSSD